MTEHQRPFATRASVVAFLVVAILGVLYFNGSLDTTLYHVHLNWNDCGENAFGTVYCGDQLTQAQSASDQAIQRSQQILDRIQSTTP